MAYNLRDDFGRPVPLALAALAIVGWLLFAYYDSQASDARSQMEDGLRRAEVVRQGLAADLQNLQKAAGTAADLKKQSDDAQKALADAVSARTSAQNNLAELTKQINEAKVAVSNAQEEAGAKASDLQTVEAKLKAASEQLTTLQGQTAAMTTQQTQALADLTAAQKQATAAQGAAAALKTQLADLQRQVNEATRNLVHRARRKIHKLGLTCESGVWPRPFASSRAPSTSNASSG